MFKFSMIAVLLSLSFPASADAVLLRCTFNTGAHSGQSGLMAFSEEQGAVVWGNERVHGVFSTHSIEWSNAGANFRLDRVNGNLFIQVRQAPFANVGNCAIAPTETRF